MPKQPIPELNPQIQEALLDLRRAIATIVREGARIKSVTQRKVILDVLYPEVEKLNSLLE